MQRGACSSSSRPPAAHHHYCTAGGCSGPSWKKVTRNSCAAESCKRHVDEAQAGQRNEPGSKCAVGFRRRPSTALNLLETSPCQQDLDLHGVCTPCCAMRPRSVDIGERLGAASSVCPADSEWAGYMKNVVERARYDAHEDCKPCSSSLKQDEDDGGCPCARCSPPPPPRKAAAAAPNSGKISQFPEQQLENECIAPPRVPEMENPSVSGRTSCPPICNIPATDDCLEQTGRLLRKKNPLYKRDHPQYHLFREDAHDVPPASPCYSDASGMLCPPPGQVMFPNTVKSNPLQPSVDRTCMPAKSQ